ncbi:hypothetical protein [Nocardioides antri]|uniref:Uncharacterized protein n=1 Tax=Nocardioides antri TaxID=2607659 RepID=A0A5B1M4R7_9ACTN|nr:hypothetical protein [Nocardioides antri]KAA1427903.1 hypothetical protein F0U47_10860 [Nocardioides antri]
MIMRVVAGCLLLALAAGCSEDTPPGEAAPELATQLEKVDAAIEAGELEKARNAVEALIADTAQARVEGDISDEQADRIFEAAQDVLAELPESGEGDG